MNDFSPLTKARTMTLVLLIVLWFLFVYFGMQPAHAQGDRCEVFDAWVGGTRFNYTVDYQGDWNLPDDVEQTATLTFPNSGIWKYYSPAQNQSYVIVFLSLEATQPPGAHLGQHDICVYSLPGLGMGER